ncbi:MAG: hypothetical protein WKF67_08085 [Rubrobacteraceae bacterium]
MGLRAIGRSTFGRGVLRRLTRAVEVDSNQRLINSGEPYIWGTQGDQRVRGSHEHIDGSVRKNGEPFPNGLRFPKDPEGDISEVANCRCYLTKYRG